VSATRFFFRVPALLQRFENPFGKVHFCAHLHSAVLRKGAFGVRKIEIHFALGVPPGLDQVAVQRAVKPHGLALRRKKNLHQALRGGVPQSREINNVPAIGEQDAIAAVLRKSFLQQFCALLVPL